MLALVVDYPAHPRAAQPPS